MGFTAVETSTTISYICVVPGVQLHGLMCTSTLNKPLTSFYYIFTTKMQGYIINLEKFIRNKNYMHLGYLYNTQLGVDCSVNGVERTSPLLRLSDRTPISLAVNVPFEVARKK